MTLARYPALLATALLLTGCGVSFSPTTTPVTPTASPTRLATILPIPTPTYTPVPTPRPTSTPPRTSTPTRSARRGGHGTSGTELPFSQFRDAFNVPGSRVSDVTGWTFPAGARLTASAAADHDALFVGTSEGRVYAVDVRSGLERWTLRLSGRVLSSPDLGYGRVYFATDAGDVYAIDPETGQVLARTDVGSGVRAPLTAGGGAVLVADEDGGLHSLNPYSLRRRWRFRADSAITTRPALSGGNVVVTANSGTVYALRLRNGHRVWSVPSAGSSPAGSPSISRGLVYIVSASGTVTALRATSGSRVWSRSVGDGWVSTPAVEDGRMIAVAAQDDRARVVALDAESGRPRWSVAPFRWSASSPALVDGVVYVGSKDGSLYALSVGTGRLLWRYATGQPVASSPIVASGRAYFGNDGGRLYAVGQPEMDDPPLPVLGLRDQWTDSSGDVGRNPGYVDLTSAGARFASYRGVPGITFGLGTSVPLPSGARQLVQYVFALDYTEDSEVDYYLLVELRPGAHSYSAALERRQGSGLMVVQDHLPLEARGSSLRVFLPLEPQLTTSGTSPVVGWYAYSVLERLPAADNVSDQGQLFVLRPGG